MSWQSSAVMWEARAGELQKQLDRALADLAQLQDELKVSKDETIAAFEFTKPPVTIDTGARIASGGGDVRLPDGSAGLGYVVVAAVVGLLGILWLFVKRK